MPFKEWVVELEQVRIYVWRQTHGGRVISFAVCFLHGRATNGNASLATIARTDFRIATFWANAPGSFTSRRFQTSLWNKSFTMPFATAEKSTKRTPASSTRTSRDSVKPKVVTVRPCEGTLTSVQFDAIVKEHRGRPLTADESRNFRRFAKDPYP